MLQEAARALSPTSTIDPFVLVKSPFANLFKPSTEPAVYIHMRVSRVAFTGNHCVSCGRASAALPDLPMPSMNGLPKFIQARSTVSLSILQLWLGRLGRKVDSRRV